MPVVCLDSNLLMGFLRNDPSATVFLAKLPPSEAKTTIVNACELYEGAFRAQNPEKTLPKIEGFLTHFEILQTEDTAARIFGEIVGALSKRGKRPSDFDALIAAIALAHGEALVTRDAHFKEIRGLKVIRW